MKHRILLTVVLSLGVAAVASGQTAIPFVTGKGTPTYIPLWTGQRMIGNSALYHFLSCNVAGVPVI